MIFSEELRDIRISGLILVSLVENSLEPFTNYGLFFDNLFTSRLINHWSSMAYFVQKQLNKMKLEMHLLNQIKKCRKKEGEQLMNAILVMEQWAWSVEMIFQ